MRRLLLSIALLSTARLSADILVREPMIVFTRRFELPRVCGTSVRVDACTAFVGQRLAPRCEARDGRWHLTAAAQFIPVMYVLGVDRIGHERDHITDIETSLAHYLRDLEQRPFASAEECEAAGSAEAARFPRVMDDFKRESNAKRHPR